jgi:hypothetical protein
MRRTFAALVGGVILATLGGCGGGGESPQAGKPTGTEPTASIPGPKQPPESAASMPEFPVLAGEILPPIEDDSQRMALTRKQIDTLNTALQVYIQKHKNAPATLEDLSKPTTDTEGTVIVPGFVDASLLVDPWNAPIQYDPSGIRNRTKQPDIWSLGPPAGSVQVGNWSDKPTPAPGSDLR